MISRHSLFTLALLLSLSVTAHADHNKSVTTNGRSTSGLIQKNDQEIKPIRPLAFVWAAE